MRTRSVVRQQAQSSANLLAKPSGCAPVPVLELSLAKNQDGYKTSPYFSKDPLSSGLSKLSTDCLTETHFPNGCPHSSNDAPASSSAKSCATPLLKQGKRARKTRTKNAKNARLSMDSAPTASNRIVSLDSDSCESDFEDVADAHKDMKCLEIAVTKSIGNRKKLDTETKLKRDIAKAKSTYRRNLHKLTDIYAAVDSKSTQSSLVRTVILVASLRLLGFAARLVLSSQIMPLKPGDDADASDRRSQIVKPETSSVMKVASDKSAVVSTKTDSTGSCHYWSEVYLPSEERWISVSCVTSVVDDRKSILSELSQSLAYVMATDNDGSVKEIMLKYATTKFGSIHNKLRAEHDWLANALRPFETKHCQRDKAEDMETRSLLLSEPLPSTVVDLKNHPFFVLQRDLRKYEVIHPPDVKAIGFVRNEAVFARSDVYALHAKEYWMKEARVVKPLEEPCKIVKGRAKPGQPERQVPLYGFWQTSVYKPKPAENGIVPRNTFGNVELFKSCMLPPGTVHLPISGILPLAKKLNIDAAQAMIGWEFRGRSNYPVFDGVVVCTEYAEMLLDAWNQEQSIQVYKDVEVAIEACSKNSSKLEAAYKGTTHSR